MLSKYPPLPVEGIYAKRKLFLMVFILTVLTLILYPYLLFVYSTKYGTGTK